MTTSPMPKKISDAQDHENAVEMSEPKEIGSDDLAQLDKKQTKQYLSSIIKPHKKQTQLALVLAMIAILVFIVQSYLIADLFADWLITITNNQPLTTQKLWQILPWLALCLLVRPVLNFAKDNILLKTSLTIRQQVRTDLLGAIVSLGQSRQYFGSDGNLSNKVLEQVDALDGYISRFYIQTYIAVLTPLIIVVATAFYSPLAAVLMLLTAPLVPVFMILVGSAAADKSREQFQAMSELSGRFLDLIRGMPTLKRLQSTQLASSSIRQASTQYQKRTMSVLKLAFLSGGVLELFASLAIALVALYLGLGLLGILPWAKGTIPVDYQGALFILLLAPEFYAPLRQLGSDYHAKANAEGAVAEFYPLLKATEYQAAQIQKQEMSAFDNDFERLVHAPAIQLDNFSITSHDDRVRLSPVSFKISAGNRVAIAGESGAGKSSLLLALLGFVSFEGNLSINDTQVTQQDLIKIRQQMGYLAQNSTLLPMSIADNLRLANKQATDETLVNALQQVELWQLIKNLPNGLDTKLGERGKGLSGGQQQRLSIAQLLLQDSSLWLLDEPCAHLDPETSQQIFDLLGKVSQDKTVLLVSHELSQIDWLDDVITLAVNNNTHC